MPRLASLGAVLGVAVAHAVSVLLLLKQLLHHQRQLTLLPANMFMQANMGFPTQQREGCAGHLV